MLIMDRVCRTTFFKDSRLNYPNVIKVFMLLNEERLTPYRKNDREDPLECLICKLIVSTVRSTVSLDNVTVEEVEHILDTICQRMPITIRGPCHDFVHKYYNLFAQLIITIVDEGKVCTTLNACKKSIGIDVVEVNKAIGFIDLCASCKLLSNVLKAILREPYILQSIKDGITKVCDKMPNPLNDVCHSELKTHWKEFINTLNSFNAEKFCRSTKMCSAGEELSSIGTYVKDNCTPCKLLSTLLKSVLDNPNTLNYLRNAINRACDKMPVNLKNMCHSELQTHWRDFINMLNHFNAVQFCKSINLCSVWKELPIVDKNENCESCQLMANMLKTALSDPGMAQIIKNEVLNACQEMNPQARFICKMAVNQYWSQLIIIVEHSNVFQFCRRIKLCSQREELHNINTESDVFQSCVILSNLMQTIMQEAHIMIQDRRERPITSTSSSSYRNEMQKRWQEWINVHQMFDPNNFCRSITMNHNNEVLVARVAVYTADF